MHTVLPPDDEPSCNRNMWRLKKYTKNNLCIKLVFLYTRNIIKKFYFYFYFYFLFFFAVDVCGHVHTRSTFDLNCPVHFPSYWIALW